MTGLSDDIEMDLRKRVDSAVRDREKFRGMRRAFDTNIHSQDSNREKIDEFELRRERARESRRRSLNDPNIRGRTIEQLRSNGIRVLCPKSREDALQIILNELGDEKLVVKSKSNITKEIELAQFLESKGIEVVETDAGDRIVQVSGERTVHPTGPAVHLTRYDIAEIMSEHFGRRIEPDPDKLIEEIRKEVSEYISRARVGITGANFITAEEGAVVIVHNEGNVSLCARRPKKHIIVSAPEKIVANLDEAMNLVKLQTFYGTGGINSAYIDIISGPSRTADIEKKTFFGMHGPSDIVLVLVDNGRSSITDSEVMYCINCGGCLLKCPVYDVMGYEFGGHTYLGGRGLCFTADLDGMDEAVRGGISCCTNCGLCVEMCPVRIDTPRLVREVRQKAIDNGAVLISTQRELIENVRKNRNPWSDESGKRAQWASDLDLPRRGKVLYFAGCFPSFRSPKTARAALDVLRAGGIEVCYLGENEVCCGSPILKLGDSGLLVELARQNYRTFKDAGVERIITSCAGCFNMLSSYSKVIPEFDIKVEHISSTLSDLVKAGKIRFRQSDMHVTYHDPCDLGRHMGIYDEPRAILKAIPNLKFTEMGFSKEMGLCCGAGAGVKKIHPDLARLIAAKRIESASETGAEYLVTACPFCEKNFEDALVTYPSDIKIVDLIVMARDLIE